MKRLLFIALFMLLGPAYGAGGYSPIPRLVKEAQVGTDETFKAFLESHKHSPALAAPAQLRQFLLGQRVLRIQIEQGFQHEGSRASLSWWFGEIGVPGKASEARAQLDKFFKDAGFSQRSETERGREILVCSQLDSQGRFATTVRIGVPKDWVGGKEAACGFDLKWTVSDMQKSPAPDLQMILADLPGLRDARLEEGVYNRLKAVTPLEIGLGGTWTRFYAWDITMKQGPELEGLLKELGYKPMSDEGSWSREATGSYAYLKKLPDGRVELRFQPQS